MFYLKVTVFADKYKNPKWTLWLVWIFCGIRELWMINTVQDTPVTSIESLQENVFQSNALPGDRNVIC